MSTLQSPASRHPSELVRQRMTFIEYLHVKIQQADWHGVSDIANDLRVLEAYIELNEAHAKLSRFRAEQRAQEEKAVGELQAEIDRKHIENLAKLKDEVKALDLAVDNLLRQNAVLKKKLSRKK